jgi:hypothetical protein
MCSFSALDLKPSYRRWVCRARGLSSIQEVKVHIVNVLLMTFLVKMHSHILIKSLQAKAYN